MKKMVYLMLCFLASASFAQAVQSAEVKLKKTFEWETAPRYTNTKTIGGVAGLTQGLGITYRRWYTEHGYQIGFIPVIAIEEKHQNIFSSLGLSYLHAIWDSPLYDFFGQASRNLIYSYTGVHYVVERGYEEYTWGQDNDVTIYDDLRQDIFVGTGIGLQMNINAVQLSVGLGYAVSLHDTRDWGNSGYYPRASTAWAIHPTIDATLGYTFGWK